MFLSLSVEEADALRTSAYTLAEDSKDELFHAALYNCLLDRQMATQLLSLRTPYIEAYLGSDPLTLEKCELLWQYHVKNGNYFSAAQVLSGLAQSDELELSLFQRVEYLSLAVSNAKSAGAALSADQNLVAVLTDIEEKLEVAQVQVELYRAISELSDLDDQQKNDLLSALDSMLLDISSLYRDFAAPLELYDAMIMIFHVSDHQDADLVKETWRAFLDFAHNSAASAQKHEAVAASIIDLGRRFFPSEAACPIGE